MKNRILAFGALTLGLLMSFTFGNPDVLLRKKHFNTDKNGIALEGYDPVAYFKVGKAIKGSSKYAVNADGIVYHCSNSTNQQLFIANYKSYEPAYGGWCAFAMGKSGEKVSIDPETFKITNGRLYLFYNAFFKNTKNDWDKDEKNLQISADNNWKKLYK